MRGFCECHCPESDAMKRLLLLTLVAGPAFADEAAFLRCRSIAEPAARLACYDAVPAAAVSGARTNASPSATKAPTAAAVAPAATAAAAAPVAPAAPGQRFGLPATEPDAQLNRIESRIVGKLDGWGPKTRFRLENGQVWQVADDSGRILDLDSPKVAVRRGALGVFYLEIEGTNHSPRVKRLQ